ncbi:MAG TPA: DJ-1/PfpI family protein [Blastocatellia bacterium]|nr:DJ-1/PfpI family protein [Blastocatellia bacterium]
MRKPTVSVCLFILIAFICLACDSARPASVSADQAPQKRGNVAILIFKGVQIIDYTGPYEVFGGAGFNVYTVAEKPDPVTTAMGMTVTPKYSFSDSPTPDVLVLPGGGGYKPGQDGVGGQIDNAAVIKWIQDNSKDAKFVLTVCNGAFFAAKAGLLDGLEATTFYGMIDALKGVAPKTKVVSDKRYVDNGKIITTAGLSSGIDGSLYLVSKMLGRGTAQAVALNMEYNWDPESKYARAALADEYMRFAYDGIEAESLSREGGTDHWENKWLLKTEAPATEIFEVINKTLAANKTYAPTAVKWVRQDSVKAAGPTKSLWKFTDENGKTWVGVASVQPVPGEKGKLVMSVKIARDDTAARSQIQ